MLTFLNPLLTPPQIETQLNQLNQLIIGGLGPSGLGSESPILSFSGIPTESKPPVTGHQNHQVTTTSLPD